MDTCPVCEYSLNDDPDTCVNCGTDLNFLSRIDNMPEKICQSAFHMANAGNDMKALSYYHLARELDPEDPEKVRQIAIIYEKNANFKAARKYWNLLLSFIPQDSQAQSHLKNLLSSEKQALNVIKFFPSIDHIRKWWLIPIAACLIALGWGGNFFLNSETNEKTTLAPIVDSQLQKRQQRESHTRQIATSLASHLPDSVNVAPVGTGIKLSGTLKYPWDLKNLLNSATEWDVDLLDSTNIHIEYPQAFHYQIIKGDTLSKLADRFLGDLQKWRQIYQINQNVLKNPNIIQIGQKIIVARKVYPLSGEKK